jgi:Ca2+-dependent lipid-binding protein
MQLTEEVCATSVRAVWLSDIVDVGKSDPFAVFSLNGQRVFKSATKKKTLNPDWQEDFVTSIVSFTKFS